MKIRGDAVVARLTPEQLDELDQWVFVKKVTYGTAAFRVREKFKVPAQTHHIRKYHERQFFTWNRLKIMKLSKKMNEALQELVSDDNDYLKAVLTKLGQLVFERALGSQSQEDLQDVLDSLRVLIASKHEGHHADRVALQREKWEFDVSRVCVAHLKELQEIIANNSLDEHARLQAIRKRLFGENLPE